MIHIDKTSNVKDMCCLFYGCELLNNINFINLETKNVEKMNGMFYQCKSLKELDLFKLHKLICFNDVHL